MIVRTPVDELPAEYREASIVESADEPGWGHVEMQTPDGARQFVADLHLLCGSVSCITQVQPDGRLRHVCRECARDGALRARGG